MVLFAPSVITVKVVQPANKILSYIASNVVCNAKNNYSVVIVSSLTAVCKLCVNMRCRHIANDI